MNKNKHFLCSIGLFAILCFSGVVWAQDCNSDRSGKEKQFLSPFSTESPYQSSKENPYQSFETPNGPARHKTKEINQKKTKVKNIINNKTSLGGPPKADFRSPSRSQYGTIKAQSSIQKKVGEGAPIAQTYNQSGSSTPTSFLDGYFLKSLHEDKLGRKISRDEGETKDNIQQQSQKRNNLGNKLK